VLPTYHFVAGARLAYRLDYSATGKADFRPLLASRAGAGAQAHDTTGASLVYGIESSLQGELSTTGVRADAHHVVLFLELRGGECRILINGQPQEQQAEDVRAALARGVLVEMTPKGQVTGVRIGPATAGLAREYVLSLMAAIQFVLPPGPVDRGSSWQTDEGDRNGHYRAEYTLERDATQARPGETDDRRSRVVAIRKTKLHYVAEGGEGGAGDLPGQERAEKTVTAAGGMTARFDVDQGRILTLEGEETLKTRVNGKEVAEAQTTLRLSRATAAPATQATRAKVERQVAALEGVEPLALFSRRPPEEVQATVQRKELGTTTADELLARLAALEAQPDTSAEQPLYLKLKALVYLRPETCPRLGRVLAKATAQGPTFRILAGALGAVNHSQAQEALVAAIRTRPNDWPALANLIPTLASAPVPSLGAESLLREYANRAADPNVSATALLALGTIAHNLAKTRPPRAQRLVDELVRHVQRDHSESDRARALEALGNAGPSSVPPVVEGLCRASSPVLRAAAADALRLTADPTARDLLLQLLSSDEHPDVRLAAAHALGFQKMNADSQSRQAARIASEGDERVRAMLLANLWNARRAFPEGMKVIEGAAASDASPYVKKVAQGMLDETP